MGIGKIKKKAKSATKTATKTAKKVTKPVKKVANTPVARTAVTAVATYYGGQQGQNMVNKSYDAMNEGGFKDALISSINPKSLTYKSKIDSVKDQYSSVKDQYSSSAFSALIPTTKTIDKAGVSALNTLNSGLNKSSIVSTPKKKKSLIAELLSWFGF